MFNHEQKSEIIKDLKNTFNTTNAIESIFEKYSINDIEEKIAALKECNKSVQTFYTPNYHYLTLEDKYIFEIESFKHKTWDKVALYDKHGL